MSRIAYDQIAKAQPTAARPWSPLRFVAWTTLLCAMTFWATLIIAG